MKPLENKVSIITGSAQGIGRAIADKFVAEGSSVVVVDINLEKATQTAKELEAASGQKCIALRADVSSLSDIEAVIAETVNVFGKIDVLVNNAGIQPPKAPFWEISPESFDRTVSINLKSVFLFTKAIAPLFMKQGFGNIVNTASVAGLFLWEGSVDYIVTKAAIIDLTKAMAFELSPYNIRVNAVAPGHVNTEINREMLAQPGAQREIEAVPMRRIAEPEDLAGAFVFLAKDASNYITGHTIYVDGGLTQIK